MSSVASAIADAMVAELNGHAFSQTFTAVRAWRAYADLKDIKDLRVTLMPKSSSQEMSSRAGNQQEFQVDVGVQKKVADTTPATIDPLMSLSEEIVAFAPRLRPATYPAAVCIKAENSPIFNPDHLDKFRQWTSVITLTFRVFS